MSMNYVKPSYLYWDWDWKSDWCIPNMNNSALNVNSSTLFSLLSILVCVLIATKSKQAISVPSLYIIYCSLHLNVFLTNQSWMLLLLLPLNHQVTKRRPPLWFLLIVVYCWVLWVERIHRIVPTDCYSPPGSSFFGSLIVSAWICWEITPRWNASTMTLPSKVSYVNFEIWISKMGADTFWNDVITLTIIHLVYSFVVMERI